MATGPQEPRVHILIVDPAGSPMYVRPRRARSATAAVCRRVRGRTGSLACVQRSRTSAVTAASRWAASRGRQKWPHEASGVERVIDTLAHNFHTTRDAILSRSAEPQPGAHEKHGDVRDARGIRHEYAANRRIMDRDHSTVLHGIAKIARENRVRVLYPGSRTSATRGSPSLSWPVRPARRSVVHDERAAREWARACWLGGSDTTLTLGAVARGSKPCRVFAYNPPTFDRIWDDEFRRTASAGASTGELAAASAGSSARLSVVRIRADACS